MTEEEFNGEIADIDNARNGGVLREKIEEVKSAVADRFGPCANTATEGFQLFARQAENAHPASAAAREPGASPISQPPWLCR